jgi:hypothetical protein
MAALLALDQQCLRKFGGAVLGYELEEEWAFGDPLRCTRRDWINLAQSHLLGNRPQHRGEAPADDAAFETLGLERVAFRTDILNERSQRAIERLGATREGVHPMRCDRRKLAEQRPLLNPAPSAPMPRPSPRADRSGTAILSAHVAGGVVGAGVEGGPGRAHVLDHQGEGAGAPGQDEDTREDKEGDQLAHVVGPFVPPGAVCQQAGIAGRHLIVVQIVRWRWLMFSSIEPAMIGWVGGRWGLK